jgi:hypothetical protein
MRLTVERARVMPGLHDFDWFCLSPINSFEKKRCAHAVSDTTALDLQLARTPSYAVPPGQYLMQFLCNMHCWQQHWMTNCQLVGIPQQD